MVHGACGVLKGRFLTPGPGRNFPLPRDREFVSVAKDVSRHGVILRLVNSRTTPSVSQQKRNLGAGTRTSDLEPEWWTLGFRAVILLPA